MPNESVPLFLAPMAGVSDLAFRLLARECGADLTITEFTAAAALTRKNAKSWHKVASDPREKPFIPQIFGGDSDEMARCTEMLQGVADIIDLNFGCPAPKVTRHCAGAALMGHPDELVEMVERCIAVSGVPITVKMRMGTGSGSDTVLEIAGRLEDVGAQRLCVHGRTLRQRYTGEANWDVIRQVVEAVDIPVVANGDVIDARSAAACIEANVSSPHSTLKHEKTDKVAQPICHSKSEFSRDRMKGNQIKRIAIFLLVFSICAVIVFLAVNLFYGLLGDLWTPAG